MIKVCPNKLMQYANRECNAIMTIAKCTNNAASSNDSNHHSSTPAAWFASGTAYPGRRYQNLGSWTYWRSYTIVDIILRLVVLTSWPQGGDTSRHCS